MNNSYYLLHSLFQNRNRYYGAYPLRLYYNERLLKSTMFAIFGFVAFIYIMRWGFRAETYVAMANTTHRDSSKLITFIDPNIIKPEEAPAAETVKPQKGTPNTQPVIAPNTKATLETLDPKKKGTLKGDAQGKTIEGTMMPGTGPITFVVLKAAKQPIYTKADKPANFQGLYEYLGEELTYPEYAKKQGILKLSFVVEIDGSLSNIRIEQSLEKLLDEQAITAFEKISKPGMWKPAIVKGEQVRYRYIIPINFEKELKK